MSSTESTRACASSKDQASRKPRRLKVLLEPQSLFRHEKSRYQIACGWLAQSQSLLVILANREKERGATQSTNTADTEPDVIDRGRIDHQTVARLMACAECWTPPVAGCVDITR
ncbi:hypothetical protein FPOAC2_04638 [Fusarium poae]